MGHHLRAAIYARVSSDQQAEARTIESQIEALLDRVRGDEVTVDEELKFIDEGYSGATLVRPALERLRDLAFAGAVDRLYVHSPDRLARKYAYQVLLVEELQRHGVELVFLDHQPGHTAEQDLLLQVQGMLAEYERAKMLERSRRGTSVLVAVTLLLSRGWPRQPKDCPLILLWHSRIGGVWVRSQRFSWAQARSQFPRLSSEISQSDSFGNDS